MSIEYWLLNIEHFSKKMLNIQRSMLNYQ